MQVSGSRETGWPDPLCSILQNRCQYLGIGHGFTREQRRVLHLRVSADQPDGIQRGRSCTNADSRGVAAKDAVEPMKCRCAAEISCFGRVEKHESRRGRQNSSGGRPVLALHKSCRKRPNLLLIGDEVGEQKFPRDWPIKVKWPR